MDERIRLILDIQGARTLDEAKAAAGRLKESLEDTAGASDKAGSKVAGMGQSMLQTGRIVQDFAQGGIGGVLNNIEGLVASLGGGAGLAGALTVAGVAFALLRKPVMDLIDSFGEGDGAAAAQARAIEKLTEAGAKLKEQLGELNALSDLRVKKMDDENRATERRIKLEEARASAAHAAADREARAQAEAAKMEGEPSVDEKTRAPSEKRRADELKKIIGGDPEAKGIREALRGRVYRQVSTAPESGILNQQAIDAEVDKRVNEVLGKFYAGDAGALDEIIGSLHPQIGGEGSLRGQLQQLTPGAEMSRRGRAIGQTIEGFGRKVRGKAEDIVRKKDEKLEADLDRMDDEDAKQGRHDRAKLNREVKELEEQFAEGNEELDAAARHHKAPKETPRARAGRLSREIARGSGLEVSPEMAAHVSGHEDHPPAVAMDQARLAAQVQASSGGQLSGDQALRVVLQQHERLMREQQATFGAMLDLSSGFNQQIQLLQFYRAQFSRLQQAPGPSGLPS